MDEILFTVSRFFIKEFNQQDYYCYFAIIASLIISVCFKKRGNSILLSIVFLDVNGKIVTVL